MRERCSCDGFWRGNDGDSVVKTRQVDYSSANGISLKACMIMKDLKRNELAASLCNIPLIGWF